MSYAIGLYVAGYLGDRLNLKIFLGVGAMSSMACFAAFGYIEGTLLWRKYYLDVILFALNGLG